METVLCVPLTHLGRALGVISVADRNDGYGSEEERRLETIAAYISPLIAVRIEKELAENERLRAERALEEVNRKLQLMTGVTRHDIINQLTILRGNLALSSAESQGAASRHHAEKAMVAADNIESMIRFTKEYQEMGLQAPVWQRIRRVVEKASAGIETKGLAIEDDLPQVEIWSDPLLVKVFFNLLDNTTRHGGGATRVRLSAFEKEGCLRIVYQDDGDGILPADKSRLFERGFGKNTGYGLFFAREILEMTGISICEEGAPGEGARFLISVPEGCWRPAKAQ
jgi:signal transduction histidine kinase